nr:GIY-YIG nuclease family protein [uncultured Methanoregula sp.]
MDKGIYCLVFFCPGCTVRVGALGEIAFRKGWYIYVGSALGTGGLARLERHIALSHNKDKRPKWHVDYLSTDSRFVLRLAVHAVTEERLECRLADALAGAAIPGFGSSDCDCPSHLFYRTRNPVNEIEYAFRSLGLEPVTTIIKNP